MKIVREHINEKFKETGDPLHDMGIGGQDYLWTHLVPGAKLKAKQDIGVNACMRFDNKSSYSSIGKGNIFTIKDIDYNWSVNYIYITNGWNGIVATLEQFKNRFEIVDPGDIKESLNEKFKEQSDPLKDMGIALDDTQLWAEEMLQKLKDYKVTAFGGSLPVEDARIEFAREGSADVTGYVQVRNVRFYLYFNIRDERNWTDDIPKWASDVSISSNARKGFYSKRATGKNTKPDKLLQLLSDMLNLKFRR